MDWHGRGGGQTGLPDAVIVIPGIMGSELVDAETGDVLWGLSPRSYVRFWTSGTGLERLRVTDRERAGKTGRIRATGLLRFPAASPIFGGFEPYTRLVSAIPVHCRIPMRSASSLTTECRLHLTLPGSVMSSRHTSGGGGRIPWAAKTRKSC